MPHKRKRIVFALGPWRSVSPCPGSLRTVIATCARGRLPKGRRLAAADRTEPDRLGRTAGSAKPPDEDADCPFQTPRSGAGRWSVPVVWDRPSAIVAHPCRSAVGAGGYPPGCDKLRRQLRPSPAPGDEKLGRASARCDRARPGRSLQSWSSCRWSAPEASRLPTSLSRDGHQTGNECIDDTDEAARGRVIVAAC